MIHPTAIVSPKAEIDDDVSIGPYSIVGDRVRIGAGSVIGAYVHISDYVSLGRGCRCFDHVVLGMEPQDLGFRGEESWVYVDDGATLRENVTVHRASGEGNCTRIGSGAYLMEGVHVGHNVKVGPGVVVANKTGFSGYVEVGEKAVVSGLVGVHQFVRIGRFCMVGGLAKVIKDIPPYSLADGHPARIYGINVVGLKRNGFDREARGHIAGLYRILYRSGLAMKEALRELAARYPGDEFQEEITGFITSSKRGVTPWGVSCERDREDD
ncbi:MAG: UDP-N-acetylglucosamine acyltransferase [Synergistaceae bacterium]|nr:UDP-N-acetylglucosamine acyltransferase [Synergistaceae bacterium]